jgi:hypothetical protein
MEKALPKNALAQKKLLEKKQEGFARFCGGILAKIVDDAVDFGEGVKISKEIQDKFQVRPVEKEVFIKLKNLETQIVDILP